MFDFDWPVKNILKDKNQNICPVLRKSIIFVKYFKAAIIEKNIKKITLNSNKIVNQDVDCLQHGNLFKKQTVNSNIFFCIGTCITVRILCIQICVAAYGPRIDAEFLWKLN